MSVATPLPRDAVPLWMIRTVMAAKVGTLAQALAAYMDKEGEKGGAVGLPQAEVLRRAGGGATLQWQSRPAWTERLIPRIVHQVSEQRGRGDDASRGSLLLLALASPISK